MFKVLPPGVRDPRGILWPIDTPPCGDVHVGWVCALIERHPGPHGASDGVEMLVIWDDDRTTDSWWHRWWRERQYRRLARQKR